MGSDYKKLLNKNKKKKFADPKNMGVNIDKNEYYEIKKHLLKILKELKIKLSINLWIKQTLYFTIQTLEKN